MFKMDRFTGDRNYAVGAALYAAVCVGTFLTLFLTAKIVTEIIAWNEGDTTYPANTISIDGNGEVFAVPDLATFSFSVIEEAESVEAAQTAATNKMNAAIAYVREQGVEEKDIKTTNFSVNPRYEYGFCQGFNCPPQERQLVAYEVNQSVEVKVRDTAKAGEILAGISGLGVQNISGLSFTIDDPEMLKAEARGKAVADARAKAEKLADDLGVSLKKIVSFNEDSGAYPMYDKAMSYGMGGEMMGAPAVTPELPMGESTVRSHVYITFEIR